MQKIENKFIYFVIILIFIIISLVSYIGFFKNTVDRNSYVSLVEGEGFLNDKFLDINDKKILSIGDLIKTTKEDSLAVIEWGDGSITRLGGNTSLKIDELYVSSTKDKLNISFELFSGKTWTNVISYIPGESYFKQRFMDHEAAVRGTIFNVDLENDYLYVVNHSVFLTSKSGEKIEISEQEPFSLSKFEFIRLEEFIKNFKDSVFDDLNRKLDNEFFKLLKDEIQSKINSLSKLQNLDLSNLSLEKKEELYTKYLSNYQELNFISSSDGELFDLKLSMKEKLIGLSSEEEKENLLNSFSFDFKDSIKTGSYNSMNTILDVFLEYKDNIGFSDEIFNSMKDIDFNSINQNLKSSIVNNIENLNSNLKIDSMIDILNKYKSGFQDTFNNSINNLFNN